jgi:hypothetical protein
MLNMPTARMKMEMRTSRRLMPRRREGKRQTAEGRGQRAEGRGQRAEGRDWREAAQTVANEFLTSVL